MIADEGFNFGDQLGKRARLYPLLDFQDKRFGVKRHIEGTQRFGRLQKTLYQLKDRYPAAVSNRLFV